jgi:hypothetical protein
MAHRIAHILVVFALAFAIVMVSVLGGNVLCMGNDGHLAIEPPHQASTPATSAMPSAAIPHESGDDHGPCSDLAIDVVVAVRQTAAGTPESPVVVIPPVLDVALPALLAVVAHPTGAVHPSDAAHPTTPLDCLRGVILLN